MSSDNPLLEFALLYARAGYPVVPLYTTLEPAPENVVAAFLRGEVSKQDAVKTAKCSCGKAVCTSVGKHPLPARGVNEATTDEAQILAWWAEHPEANVGIRMPPGKFVLDFDLYEPGVPERRDELRAEIPATLEQRSGLGEHWILSADTASTQFVGYLDQTPGVDLIYPGNKHIVAHPSKHWSGSTYEWVNNGVEEPAPAPPSVLARVSKGAAKARAQAPVARPPGASKYYGVKLTPPPFARQCPANTDPKVWAVYLAGTLPPAVANEVDGSLEPGRRTLTRVGCSLVAGLCIEPREAIEILWQTYNPRCVPPWDEEEFADFERVVLASGKDAEQGYLLPAPPVVEPPAILEEGAPHPLLKYGVLVDRTKPPEPLQYVFELFDFAPGKVSAIQAYAYSAKTPFALQFCLCVAAGIPFLGHPVSQRNAMFCAFEGGWLAEEREARVAAGLGLERAAVPLDFFKFHDCLSEEFVAALEDWVRRKSIGLVTIDTYGAAVPPGVDHNSSQFSDWLKRLGKLSDETGCLVVVLIHENKSAESGELRGVSGHNSLGGAVQAVVQLQRPGEDKTVLEVVSSRAVRKPFDKFTIRWKDPICSDAPTGFGLVAEREDGLTVKGEAKAEPLRSKNDRRQDAAKRADAEAREDILAWLTEHPFATSDELIKHACGGQRNAFYRAARVLRNQG